MKINGWWLGLPPFQETPNVGHFMNLCNNSDNVRCTKYVSICKGPSDKEHLFPTICLCLWSFACPYLGVSPGIQYWTLPTMWLFSSPLSMPSWCFCMILLANAWQYWLCIPIYHMCNYYMLVSISIYIYNIIIYIHIHVYILYTCANVTFSEYQWHSRPMVAIHWWLGIARGYGSRSQGRLVIAFAQGCVGPKSLKCCASVG